MAQITSGARTSFLDRMILLLRGARQGSKARQQNEQLVKPSRSRRSNDGRFEAPYEIQTLPHPAAGYRERCDKIATMSVNPKSTQLPVTNMVPRVRVVGFARNALSLFIESVHHAQTHVRVKSLISLTRRPQIRIVPGSGNARPASPGGISTCPRPVSHCPRYYSRRRL